MKLPRLEIFVLFFIICFPWAMSAQHIKLVAATDQQWSGGIAGRTGNNYNFRLQINNLRSELMPDTIWIGNEAIALHQETTGLPGNMKINISGKKNRCIIDINVGTSTNGFALRNPHLQNEEKKPSLKPPFDYKGVAMIDYHYRNRQHFYVVPGFLNKLPPINYP